MTMPGKIWASEIGLWYDDKTFTPQAYIRADLAEELARATADLLRLRNVGKDHPAEEGILEHARLTLTNYHNATK